MNRRALLASLPTLAFVRGLMAQAGVSSPRIGICAFSCHQHWKALDALNDEHGQDPKGVPIGVKFRDTFGFYRYARDLGAEGVQAPLRGGDPIAMRKIIEETGGYYEGDLRLPKSPSDLGEVESEIRSLRETGAHVARAVFTTGRRYEVFRTLADFRIFQDQARRSLELIEPILRKYQLKLAIENHKDHTSDELVRLMEHIGSEWVGVLVDTGNNIALLEEPHAVVEALSPYALSVHLKDMVVQQSAEGFLLSEVPLGTGMIDLPRVIATLAKNNPAIVLNLEMATRNPLIIPCATDQFYATFPARRTSHLPAAMERVRQNPPRGPVPTVSGKSMAQVLTEEEENNLQGLSWMKDHASD